jgi:tRNA(Arg) A34 adenosine deaminase TadA
VQEWHTLGAPWRAAFELAWEAFGAGTIPVGAVVTDADGTVLARGRNRITESSAPEGQIFGSRVAHAEINALVQLGMGRRYFDCTLWTTLEPCAQCIAAAWISTIGRVEFAAPDIRRRIEADRAPDRPVAQTFRERLPEWSGSPNRSVLATMAAAELDDVLPRIWDELAAAAPPPLQP